MLWGLEGPESDDWEAGLEGLDAWHAFAGDVAPLVFPQAACNGSHR